LTIIELKLAAAGSQADLQALRYAAFCSTMTMEQVVTAYSEFHEVAEDEAKQKIVEFLGDVVQPRLDRNPRIIIAAGSIDDQELTGWVMWLRRFGVDISCVELTPYTMPGVGIILAPRTIIPIPEAKEFMVKVEQKEASEAQAEKTASIYAPLWNAITQR